MKTIPRSRPVPSATATEGQRADYCGESGGLREVVARGVELEVAVLGPLSDLVGGAGELDDGQEITGGGFRFRGLAMGSPRSGTASEVPTCAKTLG